MSEQTAVELTKVGIGSLLGPKFQLRVKAWETDESVQGLTAQIVEHGLLEPLVVTRTCDRKYRVVAGNRRLRAIRAMSPEELQLAGLDDGIPVRVIDADDDAAIRAGLAENRERNPQSVAEVAVLIPKIRERFGWQDGAGTSKVARFLGIMTSDGKPAVTTVTQLEKLNALSPDLLRAVHDRHLSVQSGIELAQLAVMEQEEAVARAKEIQEQESLKTKGKVADKAVRKAVKETKPDAKVKGEKRGKGESTPRELRVKERKAPNPEPRTIEMFNSIVQALDGTSASATRFARVWTPWYTQAQVDDWFIGQLNEYFEMRDGN